MKVLSLFDGISCGLQALKQANIHVTKYYASEIDKYAIIVSKHNHPEIIHVGDVTELTSESIKDNIDLLIGGTPCQGFSFAGKQLNFKDERSKLFFEYVRLLKELKPRYFLLENVKMKKEYQDIISEMLGCQPIEINSSLLSAQNRKRLYWTNIPNVTIPNQEEISLHSILEEGSPLKLKSQTILATLYKENAKSMLKRHKSGLLVWYSLKDIQNSNLKQMILQNGDIGYRKFTPVECERLQTLPDNYTSLISNTQRYKVLGNGWTVKVIEHIFKGLRDAK